MNCIDKALAKITYSAGLISGIRKLKKYEIHEIDTNSSVSDAWKQVGEDIQDAMNMIDKQMSGEPNEDI